MMSRVVLQHGCCPNDLAYMMSPENEDSIFAEEHRSPDAQESTSERDCTTIADLRQKNEILQS